MLKIELQAFRVAPTFFRVADEICRLPSHFDNPEKHVRCCFIPLTKNSKDLLNTFININNFYLTSLCLDTRLVLLLFNYILYLIINYFMLDWLYYLPIMFDLVSSFNNLTELYLLTCR